MSSKHDWYAMRAIIRKDFKAVRRSKAVFGPIIGVPILLLVLVPMGLVGFARAAGPVEDTAILDRLPSAIKDVVIALPAEERLMTLVSEYLLAPLFLIVPLMVASVLAVDAFAGEKERKTIEALIHLPISDQDMFLAKVLGAFIPAVAVSWGGYIAYSLIVNALAFPVTNELLAFNWNWLLMIGFVAPAVAAFGMGVMVRISARCSSAQEANQLGGAIVLPLVFLIVGQAAVLMIMPPTAVAVLAAIAWLISAWLLNVGSRKFTRDRLAASP